MFNSTASLVAVASLLGVLMWSIVLVGLVRAAWVRDSRTNGTNGRSPLASTGQGRPH